MTHNRFSPDTVERHPGPYMGPDLELAKAIAMAVIPYYGNDTPEEYQRIMEGKIWNDHIAVQVALAAIHTFRLRASQPAAPTGGEAWPKEEIEPGRFVDVDPEVLARSSAGNATLADKLDAIFDRIEVSCDWRLSSEERQEIAEAAKALRTPDPAQPTLGHSALIPTPEQIEPILDDFLGVDCPHYEEMRRRCAQRIFDLCAVMSGIPIAPSDNRVSALASPDRGGK